MGCDGLHVRGMEMELSELSPSGSWHPPSFAREIPGRTEPLRYWDKGSALNEFIIEMNWESKHKSTQYRCNVLVDKNKQLGNDYLFPTSATLFLLGTPPGFPSLEHWWTCLLVSVLSSLTSIIMVGRTASLYVLDIFILKFWNFLIPAFLPLSSVVGWSRVRIGLTGEQMIRGTNLFT